MTVLFAAAMFVNALLLFLVQPMFAKLLLPQFGGSPAVWTTCMLFFQSALLAGYAYSHSLVRLRKPWQQAAVHAAVMALPILTLPIAVANTILESASPITSVLWLSAISVGAPFFALATSAPLLQRWFGAAHRAAAGNVEGRAPVDPYFLYAASNVGSFASLILYPTLVEPALALSTQTRVWSIGYGVAVVMTVACAVVMWQRTPRMAVTSVESDGADDEPVTWRRRGRWIALAFVPSSLMLAVTAYISTDVAAVPLLWVMPLALYLITFVITFSSYAPRAVALYDRFFPLVLLYLTWLLVGEARPPLAPMAATHLLAFFVLACLCHGYLSADRPSTTHLTDFYLSLAVGGALGGVFNSLLAPLIFTRVLEYPIALACGIFLLTFRPGTAPLRHGRWWIQPAVVGIITVAALTWPGSGISIALITWGLLLAAILVCFSVSRQRRRFGVCVLLMLFLYGVVGGRSSTDVAYASRTFFGTYRVASDPQHRSFTLFHGTTIHGRQDIGSGEPLTYYHRSSPIAQVFAAREGMITSVGAVGLGTGTLAAYVKPDQQWTFYEIDPEVERIARDQRYFTHLASCGERCRVLIGDARLSLQQQTESYDVIVLDAFSSDSIPIHLLTREAVKIYFARLRENGLLAIHISNNHLELQPVVAGAIRDLGLAGRYQFQQNAPDYADGKFPSQWAVLARTDAALGALASDKSWQHLQPRAHLTWTDDFSNIWSVIHWRD